METDVIVAFLKKTFTSAGKTKAVINWSGGIDSTVCLYLLAKSIPIANITVLHLPYEQSFEDEFLPIFDYLQMTKFQLRILSIKSVVDEIKTHLKINDPFRLGNVMARVRMITAYDYAKKLNSLVCGSENKSEHLLGYFTRFGDGASDIEPIQHVYKTHVFELGTFLGVPNNILDAQPSAGLWENQTDESEFGFSYKEADEVLSRYYDEKETLENIEKKGFRNARKIIEFAKKNEFKHKTPYTI
ncbi:MAG: NAD(+) synthase [bacterium]